MKTQGKKTQGGHVSQGGWDLFSTEACDIFRFGSANAFDIPAYNVWGHHPPFLGEASKAPPPAGAGGGSPGAGPQAGPGAATAGRGWGRAGGGGQRVPLATPAARQAESRFWRRGKAEGRYLP